MILRNDIKLFSITLLDTINKAVLLDTVNKYIVLYIINIQNYSYRK